MPKPETVVVEEPKVAPTEEQVTEQYIEKRKAGETVDLPVPAPTIPEEPPAKVEIEQQTVDAYLAERGERERKKRGGKQARIDELTKEKAELEARAKTAEDEKTAALAEAEKAKAAKPAEVVVPAVVEEKKERPKIEDFTDANDYHAAMALWAAKQSKPAEQPRLAEPPAVIQVRKQEFDRFLEKGKQFIAGHSDFNQTLEAAHVRGLTMSESARTAITRLAAPEVVYWLAKPENDLAARRLMEMDDMQQVIEVGRIAERLAVSPADFVSSAPPPGTRLTGSNARPEVQLNEITDTDEYIRQRKLQRRSARGR